MKASRRAFLLYPGSDLRLGSNTAVSGDKLDHKQGSDHQHDTDRQSDVPALDKARDDEADERDRRDRDRVRQLRTDVVDVVALRTRGGHDGGIGDRGAVVAADSARETSGDTDDLQLAAREDRQNDRDQDTEGTPGGTGRESEQARYQEDDGGQEVLQRSRRAVHQISDKVLCAHQGGHVLQRGSEGEDEDRGNHREEALRNLLHRLFEGNDTAEHQINDGKYQRDRARPRQTDGCVGVAERVDKAHAIEDAAVIDQREDGYADKDQYGQDEVDDLAIGVDALVLQLLVDSLTGGVEVVLELRVVLMHRHRAVVKAHDADRDDENEGQK